MSKLDDTVSVHPDDGGPSSEDVLIDEKSGTSRDVMDMQRMGKPQLFRVCIVALTGSEFGIDHRSSGTLASSQSSASR